MIDLFLKLALLFEQLVHLLIVHRLGQLVADGIELVEQVHCGRYALLDNFAHRFGRIELRLLLEKSHGVTRRLADLPVEFRIDAGNDSQKRAFPRGV